MWAELLRVERVGVTENFFNELGGHSLLATQLVSRVRELFGIALPLQRIFEAPTIEAFAGVLGDSEEERIRLEQMAALFLKVESLPEAELDRLLSSTAGRAEEA
jgi:acyl carrier protein